MGNYVRVIVLLIAFLAGHACYAADAGNASATVVMDPAETLFVAGDYSGAIAKYEAMIAAQPDSEVVPVWYYRISLCYWWMDKYEECFAAREKAIELMRDPNVKKDWQGETARRYYWAGKYDRALSVLASLISNNPKDSSMAQWHFLASLCHRLSGNTEEGMNALDKSIELAPTPQLKRSFRENRAIEFSLNGNYDKAKAEYWGLAKDYPSAPDLAYWNREISWCCWRQKSYSDCFRVLQKAISGLGDPDTRRTWEIGCGVRAYQLRDYRTVVSVLAERARKSSSVELSRLVARAYINLRDWNKALAAYQTLKKTFPECNREWELWTGHCYEQQGKYQKAEAIFRTLISKYPKDDSLSCTYLRLARCLIKEGKAAQAQALLDAYYRDSNHKPEALFWKAEILVVEMQKYKEALPVLQKYLSSYPKHNLMEDARWLMVSSLLHTNQWSQARTIAEALSQQDSTGNPKMSDVQADEARDVFPAVNDDAASELGSMDDLTRAPRESQAETRYAMGSLCWKKGNPDLAEHIMRNIIDHYPDCTTAKKAKATLGVWQNGGTAQL